MGKALVPDDSFPFSSNFASNTEDFFWTFLSQSCLGQDSTKFPTGDPCSSPHMVQKAMPECMWVNREEGLHDEWHPGWVKALSGWPGRATAELQSHSAPRPTFGPCRIEGALSPHFCLQCRGSCEVLVAANGWKAISWMLGISVGHRDPGQTLQHCQGGCSLFPSLVYSPCKPVSLAITSTIGWG